MKRIFISVIVFVIFIIACKKSPQGPSCGCDSPTIQTIESHAGTLKYDSIGREYYIIEPYINEYVICDSSFSQLQSIIKSNPITTHNVIFSGNLEKFCIPDSIAGYIYDMSNIKLTNIKI
jgi:hypothetical protein